MHRFVLAALEYVAPSHCAGCDLRLTPDEVGFCGGCAPLLDRLPPTRQPPATNSAAFHYGGPLADAIRGWKFDHRLERSALLGDLAASAVAPLGGLVDLVVPVPLHPQRLELRGFNQAMTLARAVARELGVRAAPRALRRVRPTRPQVGLDASARATNVKGAFVADRSVADLRVLLVDDVRTSGATLHEASAALHAEDAVGVRSFALAWADGPSSVADLRESS